MKQTERFTLELSKLLKRFQDYSTKHLENEQPFGACTVNPKYASVPPPTKKIQSDLENLATEHFNQTVAVGYYFRYWTPPILPILEKNSNDSMPNQITVDDYQMTLGLPLFDEKWQQTIIARSLIFCPLDHEQHGWSDWFESQLEAIRFTPLLHQTLKELQIKFQIKVNLNLPGKPIFQSFIYDYALKDSHFPEMTKQEQQLWKKKEIDWKIRYRLAAEVVKSASTLKDLYTLARKKAISTRNPMLKSLFREFTNQIESELIMNTDLTEEEKSQLISQLHEAKSRGAKEKYKAKRPAVCISDIECGQMLYLLIQTFQETESKNKAIAETIFFIWIAQHAAFSGLHLKEKDILNIKVTDINHQDLTILVKDKEINITGGLNEIIIAWIGESEKKNKRRLFQILTYDILEDVIGKHSTKIYGSEGKLLPKDFLEKVHVIKGARISLQLRRQITEQEELIKNSPFLINTREIKKHIKDSIQKKQLKQH